MIRTETTDSIVTLYLEHGKVNAIDLELFTALDEAVEQASDARALVLTGREGVFSAGVDLFRVLDDGDDYLERFLPIISRLLRRLLGLPIPVVGALGGHAIAGGYLLAAACDRRILATGKARLGVPELAVGVPFPGLALGLLQSLVPGHVANDLVTTGRLAGADEALGLGLVDELVAPEALLSRAHEIASQLAAIPRTSFTLTKEQLRAPLLTTDYTAIDERVLGIWRSDEAQEAIRTYLERTVGKKG